MNHHKMCLKHTNERSSLKLVPQIPYFHRMLNTNAIFNHSSDLGPCGQDHIAHSSAFLHFCSCFSGCSSSCCGFCSYSGSFFLCSFDPDFDSYSCSSCLSCSYSCNFSSCSSRNIWSCCNHFFS